MDVVRGLVSVIIPTRNRQRTIARCLQSIQRQTYDALEIFIVDNHSSDRTAAIARQYAQVIVGGTERSSQRNIGARHARGEFLLFIDSDMELTPGVIADCVAQTAQNDALVIPEQSVGSGFWTRCKILERSCYGDDMDMVAARFFRRTLFDRLHGYDEAITGQEDLDLHLRAVAAGRVGNIPALIYHDEGRLTFWRLVRKKYYYCLTLPRYLAKHPAVGRRQMRFFRPAFLHHWRRFLADPAHAFGFFVMRLGESFGAVAGYLVGRFLHL